MGKRAASGIFLSLGSNVGDRKHSLTAALAGLEKQGVRVLQQSSFYATEPVEAPPQPDFLNLACEVETESDAQQLLQVCWSVEEELGRTRSGLKQPRTLDIDLLFFRDRIIRHEGLTVPHPRLYFRKFVLVPLAEIAPDFRDPVSGYSIGELLARCPDAARVQPWVGTTATEKI